MGKQLDHNIKAHDKISQRYEKEHGEIYNEFEQKRLEESLMKASEKIETGSRIIEALDFGCGAGNLSRYLLKMDMWVTASDVSENFLQLVRAKYCEEFGDSLLTLKLNGKDISNVGDNVFDFIATYSVLHHIPNYLLAVEDLIRVLKPGGVLYIDHEASSEVWSPKDTLNNYNNILKRETLKKTKIERLKHLFVASYWIDAFKELIDCKFKSEGDIHVFKDDHIEWNKVERVLQENKMEIIYFEDYLLRTKHCPQELYDNYKDKCHDIRLLVARKIM